MRMRKIAHDRQASCPWRCEKKSRISRPQDLSANSLTTGVLTNGSIENSSLCSAIATAKGSWCSG